MAADAGGRFSYTLALRAMEGQANEVRYALVQAERARVALARVGALSLQGCDELEATIADAHAALRALEDRTAEVRERGPHTSEEVA